MSAITGFSYTIKKRRKLDASSGTNECHASLTAGDGALTYPTGGIPFDKSQLGFNSNLEEILFTGQTTVDGYIYKYDIVNKKIMLFQAGAQTLVMSSYTPAGTITNGTPDTFAGTPAVLTGTLTAAAPTELPNTATPQLSFNILGYGY